MRTILIVDDVGVNRLLPGLILRPYGWDVVECTGGLEAINLLKNKNFECVLLDISMPDLNGLEVLHYLRTNSHFSNLKVVAYTATSKDDGVESLIQAGFDAVILKPLTSIKLVELLNSL